MTAPHPPTPSPLRGEGEWLPVGVAAETLTLDAVVARLATRGDVAGVLAMGSGGDNSLNPHSDYDLLVVTDGSNGSAAGLHLVVTRIERRLAEVYVVAADAVERLLDAGRGAPPLSPYSYDATVVAWLRAGRILFDRTGLLARARERVREEHDGQIRPPSDGEAYGLWFHINYNVRQTRRMAASDDPIYRLCVDYRLLYTLADLPPAYFQVRKLPGPGEKDRLRHLMAHDPAYLDLFRRCVDEPDRARKVDLYVELAGRTVAPVGPLWDDGATAVRLDPAAERDATRDDIAAALSWWRETIADEEPRG